MSEVESPSGRLNLGQISALSGLTEGAIRWRIARSHLPQPDAEGTFDRAAVVAALAAKPKGKGGRRRGQRAERPEGSNAPDSAAAEVRYRLARADREELLAAKLREESLDRHLVVRSVEAWTRECRAALMEIPTSEADVLAEALALDPSSANAKRELERICRAHAERMSQRAFQMGQEQA